MTTTRRATSVAFILGVAYLGAALFGFIPVALSPPAADAPELRVHALHGQVFGLFHVNLLHTLVHLAIGAWGILAAAGALSVGIFLRSIAVFYGALAVMGLIPGLNTMWGFVPIHGHDVWLHGATALVAGGFGFRMPAARGADRVPPGTHAAGR